MRPIHGHAVNGRRSPTFISWTQMKQRCLNPRHHAFAMYGGRGITVCERWMKFENFLADMGERPTDTTLDRKDSTLGYDSVNCQWATSATQGWNKRSVKLDPHEHVQIAWLRSLGYPRSDVARFFGISGSHVSTICRRYPTSLLERQGKVTA